MQRKQTPATPSSDDARTLVASAAGREFRKELREIESYIGFFASTLFMMRRGFDEDFAAPWEAAVRDGWPSPAIPSVSIDPALMDERMKRAEQTLQELEKAHAAIFAALRSALRAGLPTPRPQAFASLSDLARHMGRIAGALEKMKRAVEREAASLPDGPESPFEIGDREIMTRVWDTTRWRARAIGERKEMPAAAAVRDRILTLVELYFSPQPRRRRDRLSERSYGPLGPQPPLPTCAAVIAALDGVLVAVGDALQELEGLEESWKVLVEKKNSPAD